MRVSIHGHYLKTRLSKITQKLMHTQFTKKTYSIAHFGKKISIGEMHMKKIILNYILITIYNRLL